MSGSRSRPENARGVGTVSGDAYRFTERDRMRGEYSLDSGSGGTMQEVWRLRNERTGKTWGLTCTVRWAFDANGDLVRHREDEHVVCKG